MGFQHVKMNRVYSNRALSILYNFLIHNGLQATSVFLPTNICHDVFFLLKHAGVKIIFLDIDKNELEINKEIAIENIGFNAKVILLWNHSYGNSHVPYDFFTEAKNKNPELIIIDDRCLCNPVDFQPNANDSLIDLILYSTGYGKQVELNYGALGIVNDKYILPQDFYDFKKNIHKELKAALFSTDINNLSIKLEKVWIKLDNEMFHFDQYYNEVRNENIKWIDHKNKLSEIYYGELNEAFFINKRFNDWRFNILVKNKRDLMKRIFREDLFISNHYPSIGSIVERKSFPIAEWLHEHVLNLFIDKHYTEEMAYRTVEIINKYGNPI